MKIFVNGEQHEYLHETADYYDIARLATSSSRDSKRGMTITYYWQGEDDGERSGTLYPSKSPIKIAAGMIFNAVHTGGA